MGPRGSTTPPSARPFRFGLSAHGTPDAATWRGIARTAESLGYSTLFVSDHMNPQLAPLVALSVAATVTETLRVGTLVLCNDLRHPAVLAKELATLDVLSEGRLEWGIGAGWLPSDYETTGIPFDGAGVRVGRMAETVTVVKGLFGDEPLTFAGDHHTITDLRGTPAPVQRPHPPLIVGAGRERLLRLAAVEADIVGVCPDVRSRQFGPFPPSRTVTEAMDRQIATLREAAGDRFDQLELNVTTLPAQVTDDRRGLAERASAGLGQTPEEVLASPHCLFGTVDEICEQLLARRERWGLSYWVVPTSQARAFAPVVERLAGR